MHGRWSLADDSIELGRLAEFVQLCLKRCLFLTKLRELFLPLVGQQGGRGHSQSRVAEADLVVPVSIPTVG